MRQNAVRGTIERGDDDTLCGPDNYRPDQAPEYNLGAKAVQVDNRLPFFLMPEESDEILATRGTCSRRLRMSSSFPSTISSSIFPSGRKCSPAPWGKGILGDACG